MQEKNWGGKRQGAGRPRTYRSFKMTLNEFLSSNARAWEDDEYMIVKGHSEMHGEPIISVTNFAHPEAGAKVYRNRDDVVERLGGDRLGEAS